MDKIKGLSFFCPAYYDGENVTHVVNKAVSLFPQLCEDYEIIVIDDGSPDNTGEVLDKLAATHDKVKVIHHPGNLGYAEALKTGFKNANKFDFILFTDGDNQYDVEYFKCMVDYMEDHDAVITYRTKNGNNFIRQIISWIFNRVLNIMFREPFKDLSSALRLVRKSAIKSIELRSTSIFLPVEVILRLHKKGFKIKEIPIETKRRLYGRSTSLLPRNFISAILDMIRLRMGKI